MEKVINVHGKRKTAVGRASLKPGKGKIMINGTLLENYQPKLYQLKIMEPVLVSGEVGAQVDMEVTIK